MAYQVYKGGIKQGTPFETKAQASRFAKSLISFHGCKSVTVSIKKVSRPIGKY